LQLDHVKVSRFRIEPSGIQEESVLIYAERLAEEALEIIPHRQLVFSMLVYLVFYLTGKG